jgi:hypothetical protein
MQTYVTDDFDEINKRLIEIRRIALAVENGSSLPCPSED